MPKRQLILIFLVMLIVPTIAQSEGIPLQKDILLTTPIFGPEDLPEEITFTLYESQTATTPLGHQTFNRGHYTVDFEFSQSDGITAGNVARVSANFTDKLDINDDPESASKTKEIWLGFEVSGTEIGDRTKVSDGTLVQLLLASDASIATYLTFAYTGDDNPIAAIYKDLPISSLGVDGTESSLSRYFSAVVAGNSEAEIGPMHVAGSIGQIQYKNSINEQAGASQFYYDDVNHRVGIGTSSPNALLNIVGTSISDAVLEISSSESNATTKAGRITIPHYTNAQGKIDVFWGSSNGSNNDIYFGGGSIYGKAATRIHFYTAGNDTTSVGNERMIISSTGNVGIGTSSPNSILSIVGTSISDAVLEISSSESNATTKAGRITIPHYTNAQGKIDVFWGSSNGSNNDIYFGGGSIYGKAATRIHFYTAGNDTTSVGNERMIISSTGNVGIGTTNTTYKLSVNGTIRAKEIIVDTGWSDFVFGGNYKLPPLHEVEHFIRENKHLPGIPSEAEVKKNGVTLGDVSSKLLQKIEELTLYVIELKKGNDSLKVQMAVIQKQLKNLNY